MEWTICCKAFVFILCTGNCARRSEAHKIETKVTKPIKKTFLSSDHTLQLGYVKPESLVIVDEPATVKLRSFSRVHTACHVGKIVGTRKS